MPTQKKLDQVEEITNKLKETAGCWFVNARGLNVNETQQLRADIRQAGAKMHVYKNRLAVLAFKKLDLPVVPDVFIGPTAFVFCSDDIAAPAKAIKDFADTHEVLSFKGGLVDGVAISVEDAQKIAELPTKEALVTMLLCALQAPITGLTRVCNAPIESLARALDQLAKQKAAA